ncbi:MAG: DUF885 domain-containing protein [Gammaproteobacteria bacterium]
MKALPAVLAAACLAVVSCSKQPDTEIAPAISPESTVSASEQLNQLVDAYYDKNLELNPIFATFLGEHRFDDRMANSIGPDHLAAQLALDQEYLAALDEIDSSQLEGQDLLTYEIFKADRESAIEGAKYPTHLVPISQFFSVPNFFAVLGSGGSAQPFATVEDYENWLSRVDDYIVWTDQAITNMREGIEKGVVQPRVLMEKTLPQLQAQLKDDPEQSVFYQPIANMPSDFSDEDRERLTAAYSAMISEKLIPSYDQLRVFIRDEYIPATRDTVGLQALPNGKEWYDYLVRTTTTTNLSSDEIHEIGLNEVARLRSEMQKVVERVGFEGDLEAFMNELRTNPEYNFTGSEEVLEAYRALKEKVNAEVPRLFSKMPKADFEIREVESFRAASSAGASYMPPAPDGSRPGVFYVNTHKPEDRARYNVEAIYVHEAAPGHHFQIAIAQELDNLVRYRRNSLGGATAYVEGWGLYAERLGKDLGLYTDPYQYFGALNAEIWRAVRLVVDTGMHAKGWTREEALEYMTANVAASNTEVVAEIERYIAIPSQALAYKIGQLKILELRARAEETLGDDFDIRAFHREILEDGPMPLGVLESKVDRWIAEEAGA